MIKTHAFSRVVGVFEGGGVRGAAFAGAYSEARKSGITFVGTVGASAGSIAASLVAASVTPEKLRELLNVDFARLIVPAEPRGVSSPRWVTSIARFIPGSIGKHVRSLVNLGQYSSQPIGEWVNSILAQQLRVTGREVQFTDLPRPLAIVAADVEHARPKIWSWRHTPTASVAHAVRASCTIPFFFQPVTDETATLVDGGLIANLPLFLEKEVRNDDETPVLCFRLVSSSRARKQNITNFLGYGLSLIEVALEGTTEVQLKLSAKRQVIDINTGDIRATDFQITSEQRNWLCMQGEKAVADFVINEQRRVAEATPFQIPTYQFRDPLLTETARLLQQAKSDIAILAGDLSWLKDLHISLLAAKLRGASIRIICERHQSDAYSAALNDALALGAEVVQVSNSRMAGTIVDGDLAAAHMVTIERHPVMHGRIYRKPEDASMIALVKEYHDGIWRSNKPLKQEGAPSIVSLSEDDICNALRTGISQYADLYVHWDSIEVAEVKPLTRYLENLKIVRLNALQEIQRRTGIMGGLAIRGSSWAITPQVVERLKSGELVVIDGLHRLFHCMSSGVRQCRVVVVENPLSNLPALPELSWDSVVVLDQRLGINERYTNFQEKEFRNLAAAYESLIPPRVQRSSTESAHAQATIPIPPE